MSLSAGEIALVVDELAARWTGARIQKIHMRGPALVLLSLHAPGQVGVLRLGVEPGRAHLAIAPARGEADPEARPFCMLLRKRLLNARLEAIAQLGGDRVVELRCTPPRGSLVAEMLGGRGQLVLLDGDRRVVALSPASPGRPGLVRGEPWGPPPPPPAGREGRQGPEPAPRLVAGSASQGALALYGDSAPAAPGPGRAATGPRADLARALAPLLRRQRRLVANIEGDLARARAEVGLGRQGELLKLNLARARKGLRRLTVDDVLADPGEGGRTVEIELEPALSPVENLERLFARARKARRALEVATGRLEAARERLERLERWRARLDEASDDELEEIARALSRGEGRGRVAPRARSRSRHTPYRTYRDARGRRILVGKSAGDNDSLTTRVARPGDLWLHARGYPGSHVVVPLEKGAQVDPDLLLDAASLAAYFSEARGESAVEVTYTPRRYVQKPRGAAPGAVTLLRERVIHLALEPKRLERLLKTQIDVDPDELPK